MQSSITQNADKISAIVSSVGSGGTVTAASIVAAINSAGSSVQISADHIMLTGYVTAEDLAGEGTTTINGSNITSGTIEGVTIKSTGEYYKVVISGGTIEVGTGDIYDDTYGTLILSDDEVHIAVGSLGKYWQFTSSGIFWCDSDGTVLNQVQLKNG